MDGKDARHGLKLEKLGPIFLCFNAMPANFILLPLLQKLTSALGLLLRAGGWSSYGYKELNLLKVSSFSQSYILKP